MRERMWGSFKIVYTAQDENKFIFAILKDENGNYYFLTAVVNEDLYPIDRELGRIIERATYD